jgi:hypothetical protein
MTVTRTTARGRVSIGMHAMRDSRRNPVANPDPAATGVRGARA